MEKTETTEKTYRINFKQTAKGMFYCEWTTRADDITELKTNNEKVRDLALAELKKLNGEQ